MSFYTCLIVMAGGALGTFARYAVSVLAMPISRGLPWGTIIINITGSLVIGFFSALTLANGRFPVSDTMRLFVIVGFCGGYTTFSSFSLQTLDLLRSGAVVRACINVAASVVLCIAAVAVGHFIATRINSGAPDVAQVTIEEQA
ncbi:fluoride efflux transporter CrcB [Rhizobium sp. WYJ-E13]|uniref:fluoride efflux transporter CrcB n=1 Tax=unclassified Rhizobium TaxID=2613769 RepID=UPI001C1EC212|nr:fluoride efflux transporter CrcB [Rhizobium sp. WYJ-E13]QWW70140.1 fluoride efflux transporter CrcB [Rhizobium sp. WYJ-E13]